MARPAKSQAREDARGELIEAAWHLFSQTGYDATPVSAIIERVGLSKGAFYYYFAGKEEILDAVVARIIDEIARVIETVPSDTTLSPLQKLSRFMRAIGEWKIANMSIILETAEVVYRDENVIIRHKMNNRTVEKLTPALAEIITQGIEAGIFDVEEPRVAAEMILRFFNAMAEMQAAHGLSVQDDPLGLKAIMRRAELSMTAIERILGVQEGAVFPIDSEMEERLEEALKGEGGSRKRRGTAKRA
jgi:AcrR family transcriptional regulator